MWRNGDTISLKGSLIFKTCEEANEFMRACAYCSRLQLLRSEQTLFEDGVLGWNVKLMKNDVSPLFINILEAVSERNQTRGTVTYMFQERFEVGILLNGDLIRLRPHNLITFAVDKLGYLEEEIKSSEYSKIKQAWIRKVWGLSK